MAHSAPDDDVPASTAWSRNVVDGLTYPRFRAVAERLRRVKRVEKIVVKALEEFNNTADQESEIQIANRLLRDVKDIAPEEYANELGNLRSVKVTVDGPDGSQTDYELEETSTFDVLKKMIQENTGEDPINQVLSVAGKEMNGSASLQQSLITNGSRVCVRFQGSGEHYDLFVQGLSRNHTIPNVSPNMSVEELRCKAASAEQMDPQSLFMSAGGKPMVDGTRLSQYPLSSLSTIFVSPRMLGGRVSAIH